MSINNHRKVASHGNTQADNQAVFVWQEDSLVTVADGSGPFDYVGFPDISDNGEVVFDAGLDNFGPHSFFTGPDAVDDLVVRAGHVVDGAAIRDFISYPEINNRGQIAFIGMADESERIFLATPIPEPSTVMLSLRQSAQFSALTGGLFCTVKRQSRRGYLLGWLAGEFAARPFSADRVGGTPAHGPHSGCLQLGIQ